ncbi:MAG: hypothetical protein HDT46_11155 [Ruminococcaceae bacterium]|nr:hypothetical protein [Oscillospiraceae bacterium]
MFCSGNEKGISYSERLKYKLNTSFNTGITLDEDKKKKFALIFYAFSAIIRLAVIICVPASKLMVFLNIFSFSNFSLKELIPMWTNIYESHRTLLWVIVVIYSAYIISAGISYWYICAKKTFNKYLKIVITECVGGIVLYIAVTLILNTLLSNLGSSLSVGFYVFVGLVIIMKAIFAILYCRAAKSEAFNAECIEEFNGKNHVLISKSAKVPSSNQQEKINENIGVLQNKVAKPNKKRSDIDLKSVPQDNEKEYVIQTAEKCMSRSVCILFAEMLFIITMLSVSLVARHLSEYAVNSYQQISPENYQQLNENILEINMFIPIFAIISFVIIFCSIFDCITKSRIKLCFTNKRVIGNTGSFFGNSTLNVPLSQISVCEARTTWIKGGIVIIKTSDNKNYSFFVKSPHNFKYNLNEEISKNIKANDDI